MSSQSPADLQATIADLQQQVKAKEDLLQKDSDNFKRIALELHDRVLKLQAEKEELAEQLAQSTRTVSAHAARSLSSASTESAAPSETSSGALDPSAAACHLALERFSSQLSADNRIPSATKKVFEKVLAGDDFLPFIQHHFNHSFVIDCFSKHLPNAIAPEPLKVLAKSLERQVTEEIHEMFKGSESFSIHVTDSLKHARMLALRIALESSLAANSIKSGTSAPASAASLSTPAPAPVATPSTPVANRKPSDAQLQSPSASLDPPTPTASASPAPGRPVFYTTQGFTVSAHGENFAFMNNCVIRVVQLVNVNPDRNAVAGYSVNLASLSAQIKEDKEAGMIPCAILATVGAENGYQVDDLWGLRKLSNLYGLWLHVEGSAILLSSATANIPQFALALFQCADSVCDAPLTWFDTSVYDSPGVCFIRNDSKGPFFPPAQLRATSPLDAFSALFRLWYRIVNEPQGFVSKYIDLGLTVVTRFRQLISHSPFDIIGPPRENHPDMVFFRLVPEGLNLAEYNVDLNEFNRWVGVRLGAALEEARITEYFYENKSGFLFHPLFPRDSNSLLVQMSTLETLVQQLLHECEYPAYVLGLRGAFKDFIDAQPHLQYIPREKVHGFVGLGAFRFLPEVLATDSRAESAKYAQELNLVCSALAKKLQSADATLYTASTADSGNMNAPDVCVVVRCGPVVTSPNCIAEIGKQLSSATSTLQLPQKVQERIAEVVRSAIGQAQQKLEDSTLATFSASNLVRNLPVVGGVWSWIAPKPAIMEEAKSQTFDIRVGELTKRPNLPRKQASGSNLSTASGDATTPRSIASSTSATDVAAAIAGTPSKPSS